MNGSSAADPREARLDRLQAEAAAAGPPAASPAIPPPGPITYEDLPYLKPPVWTWEVPLYFFVGGLSGMAAVVAFAALVTTGDLAVVRTALWLAVNGSLVSAALLVLDLGRPERFLYMLRVFKWRSPMSVGAWVLVLFSGAVAVGVALFEAAPVFYDLGVSRSWLRSLLQVTVGAGAVLGCLLATYTGVLLGATAVPAWNRHRTFLPVHFGVVALGSAAAMLELSGHVRPALSGLAGTAATFETGVLLWTVFFARGSDPSPGRSQALLTLAGVLLGPVALVLRLCSLPVPADLAFLAGAVLVRYGWVAAGRESALAARP